ncbi:trypsin-like peptidase domain-containing protein [Herbivorax sp. ANBcel31]|uniref:S1C family serine protease n=1 Tax=Herbivorax sp. ANBcel31 TaxID=3069754 RepID=UPI0027AF17EB|nr:trypsin-like peptidase domain-containing protein [Herbivorax sp. ANBcel31]MDQ2085177.1 trypsin-like peptidase domain-containing protein [Herbivorax sp. ANBcel31]
MFNEDKKRGRNFIKLLSTVVLTTLGITLFLIFGLTNYITRNSDSLPDDPQTGQSPDVPPRNIQLEHSAQDDYAQNVAQIASPGVVGISVQKVDSSALFDTGASDQWGLGSGVIVSSEGYILTNHHVVGGRNRKIIVSLSDGRNIEGVSVWCEPVLDLAIVKIEAPDIVAVPLGDANNLRVGEPAIAIGNPLGLQFQRTVTSGIISALNRTIEVATDQGTSYMEDLIQTDASINPGNSGGPLLNSRGEVIGINTIKVASAEGMGFAIPINVATPIINRYVKVGEFIEPYIGIFAYDQEVIQYLDRDINLEHGIYVANVDENGPAYRNGIRTGYIITHVDERELDTMMDLRTYIYTKNPGDIVEITYNNDGETEKVEVRLAAKESDVGFSR